MVTMTPDVLLRRLAKVHGGPFSRAEAMAVGVSAAAIDRRLGSGALFWMFPGVYLLGGVVSTFADRAVAAALACGEDAVIARRTAGVLHGFAGVEVTPREIDIAIPRERRVRVQGIVGWRVAAEIVRRDRELYRGARLTTPVRTLVDLASVLDASAYAAVVDGVLSSGAVRLGQFRRLAAESAGRPGSRTLQAALANFA